MVKQSPTQDASLSTAWLRNPTPIVHVPPRGWQLSSYSVLSRSLLVFERTDYGYNKDANGMFDGLMGELQRFECDLLSTAVYVTDERLYVLDSVGETFPLR